ncbi:MAG: Gfo/Idh/MocA family oxidoreductase [Myxococcota bacterium]
MIRVAVIGAGHWGPNLIANFHDRQRSEVAWVIDRDASRRQAVGLRFPDIRVSDDATHAFADASVDAVVIATPTSTHFDLARQALEAGRHVLVEKPMADSVRDAEALCEIAERSARILMVGHVFVFNAASQQAKRYLVDGDLGRIYYISMTRTNLGPIRVDVNAAWDLASHDIALASYWLDAQPESVSARGKAWINSGVEDAVFATLQYPNDVLVHLHASWLHPRKTRDITVVGEKRMLTFDDISLTEPLRIYDKQVSEERSHPALVDSFATFRMVVRDGDISVPKVPASQPLRNECDHFLDCIESGGVPITDGREGLAVVRTLDAISRSIADGGREVRVEGDRR